MSPETLKYKQEEEIREKENKIYTDAIARFNEIKHNKNKYSEEEYWEKLRLADKELDRINAENAINREIRRKENAIR